MGSTTGSFSFRPAIPVTFINESKKVNVFVLLDTGADLTVIPYELAKILNINLKKEKIKLRGFKEESSVYSSLIEIRKNDLYLDL